MLALLSGQTFDAGTRSLVKVTFQTAPTALYSTPVNFIDQPVTGEVADADANVLPVSFENGVVTFAQGFEADVSPRPTGSGNGTVTVADFTQIGKFVAGADTPDQLNEFQRADSAPRGTKGNGVLSVSDYTQAGRYAAALDTVQTAGGAIEAVSLLEMREIFAEQNGFVSDRKGVIAAREIRVVGAQAAPGGQVQVIVEINAQGDENAVGFTLNYDAARLLNPQIALGSGAIGATLIPNTLNPGKVGIVLGLAPGQSFPAGTRQLVTIGFSVAANAAAGQTALTFNDSPVFREVVNPNADVLAAGFVDGAVNILGPTAAGVSVGGRVTAVGRVIAKASITLTDAGGVSRTVLTDSLGYYRFDDVRSGEIYLLNVSAKGYTFNPSTRILNVTDQLADVDFRAEN